MSDRSQTEIMRASNHVEEKVIAAIEPAAAELGYRLVRVRLSGLRRKRLQIMAERDDGVMLLEDCEKLSRAISPILDAADPIDAHYDLEVSSPGIDRPLVRLEDFARFEGYEAKLETAQMIEGRKRFKGVLSGVDGERVKIAAAEGEAAIPFSWLVDAKLVLTDRLIEEDLKRAKALEAEDNAKRKEP
ncbi:MAG: ribosome maturation factor RimP [Alphaproteobacteria bacterium]|nr:ribosome maturation factor RimP [Alphaproteobacteria bacterium]